MGKIYDNWGKLVEAVVSRERLRELARCNSIASSTVSDGSSRFSFSSVSSIKFLDDLPAPIKFLDHLPVPPTNTKSFFLMAGATNLLISCGEVLKTCLELSSGDYNEFGDIDEVKIKSASWFDIRGKIKTSMLSNVTVYGAYMVYKLLRGGLKSNSPRSAKVMIRYDNYESDAYDEARAQVVKIVSTSEDGTMLRIDGWMEVHLGSFYIGNADVEEVQARLFANESTGNDVLKISGIEFRPLVEVKVANRDVLESYFLSI